MVKSSSVKVFDSSVNDSGGTQYRGTVEIKRDTVTRFMCYVQSGDTIQIQGRLSDADAWLELKEVTANGVHDVWLSCPEWRVVRTAGTGTSYVQMVNQFAEEVIAHAA